MKKVLIITYYWPPSGGAGVHRWLKLSKYLTKNNKCYVYTPENPDFALKDKSLLAKVSPEITVLKKKIIEPYFIYKAFLKKSVGASVNSPHSVDADKKSLIKRFAKWIRGNIFIPDPRVFWVKPSYKYLKRIIEEEGIDVLITTGPPQSMHLIAYRLKLYFKTNINWIADFRDPWTNIDFYDMLNVGKRADAKNRKLEKNVISTCDTLVTVSKSWARDFKELGANNVKVITNGFDTDDYQFKTEAANDYFCLTHIGSINADRNPKSLWEAIYQINKTNSEFKKKVRIKLVGNVHQNVLVDIENYGLSSNLISIPNVPHKKALEELHNSSISLLLLNDTKNIDGIVPGKIFEYMGVGNPIFAIGKTNGDTGNIINENNLGLITDFGDVEAAKTALLSFYQNYLNNSLVRFSNKNMEKFTIKSISSSFEEIF